MFPGKLGSSTLMQNILLIRQNVFPRTNLVYWSSNLFRRLQDRICNCGAFVIVAILLRSKQHLFSHFDAHFWYLTAWLMTLRRSSAFSWLVGSAVRARLQLSKCSMWLIHDRDRRFMVSVREYVKQTYMKNNGWTFHWCTHLSKVPFWFMAVDGQSSVDAINQPTIFQDLGSKSILIRIVLVRRVFMGSKVECCFSAQRNDLFLR